MAEERREVIWTTSARNELDDISVYIAKDAPLSALSLLEQVLATADTLVTLAKRGRMVPELQNPRIRELFIKHYCLHHRLGEESAGGPARHGLALFDGQLHRESREGQ